MLDSADFIRAHFGTSERKHNNLLILRKGSIRVGVLNYTYGTNGLKAAKPTIVNYIDTAQMRLDIEKTKRENLDQLIVVTHWGTIQTSPIKSIKSPNFLIKALTYHRRSSTCDSKAISKKDENQLSHIPWEINQASVNTDGGMMLELKLVKEGNKVEIKEPGYHLIWVHKPNVNGKKSYEIIPCNLYEHDKKIMNETNRSRMNLFIKNARKIMSQNVNIPEIQLR